MLALPAPIPTPYLALHLCSPPADGTSAPIRPPHASTRTLPPAPPAACTGLHFCESNPRASPTHPIPCSYDRKHASLPTRVLAPTHTRAYQRPRRPHICLLLTRIVCIHALSLADVRLCAWQPHALARLASMATTPYAPV